MIEYQQNLARGEFVSNIDCLVRNRILSASPIRQFVEDDDKKVELVQDINSDSFVRRSYGTRSLSYIGMQSRIPFGKAWDEMHKIFGQAGLGIVPSVVLAEKENREFPVVIATEFLENDIHAASTDSKAELAKGLGAILLGKGKYFPSGQMLMDDMSRVKNYPDGKEKLVLVDVDPYLVDMSLYDSLSTRDLWTSKYIKKVSELFWDKWCQPKERREVMMAFVRSIGGIMSNIDVNRDLKTMEAFSAAHIMTQGVDMRMAKLGNY